MKILVLDDEPWHLSWLADLVGARATIEFVSTYEDAVRSSRAAAPNIAIIDVAIGTVNTPFLGANLRDVPEGWQGLKFLRFLRVELGRKRSETEVIVYTVHDDARIAILALEAFQADFCPKSDVEGFRTRLLSLLR